MSLKERIKQKSADLVRREIVTLPETGETVQVRGMMFAEKERVAELAGFKQSATMIALCVEDPETGKPLWNANAQEDHAEIGALPIADTEVIVDAVRRLSGLDKSGKADSAETGSSSSSSPVLLVEPLENSEIS